MRPPLICIPPLTFARCWSVHLQSEPAPAQKTGHVSTLLIVLVVLVLILVCATLGVTVGMGGLIKKIDKGLSTTSSTDEVFATRDGSDIVTEDNYCAGTNPGQ